jgi:hypothetical protein
MPARAGGASHARSARAGVDNLRGRVDHFGSRFRIDSPLSAMRWL